MITTLESPLRSSGATALRVPGASLRGLVRSGRTEVQLLRFFTVGVTSSLVYAGVFLLLEERSALLANFVGFLLSTFLANEMHRRLTFRAGKRVGWFTAQWEGGGLALLGLGATTGSLWMLERVVQDSGPVLQVAVIAAVIGLVGLGRFVALRLWVFKK